MTSTQLNTYRQLTARQSRGRSLVLADPGERGRVWRCDEGTT